MGGDNPELPRDLERWITLQVTDTRWREHLDNMDYMRQGIGLRGYAQKDPLVEYRPEGQEMFDEMSFLIKQEVVRALMHAEVEVDAGSGNGALEPQSSAPRGNLSYRHEDAATLEALAAGPEEATRSVDMDDLPVVEQRQRRPRAATSAATTPAGAAAARSTSGATARSVAMSRRTALAGGSEGRRRGDQSPVALGS